MVNPRIKILNDTILTLSDELRLRGEAGDLGSFGAEEIRKQIASAHRDLELTEWHVGHRITSGQQWNLFRVESEKIDEDEWMCMTCEEVVELGNLENDQTIMRWNGNDKPYVTLLPEIWLCYKHNDGSLKKIEQNTGLKFILSPYSQILKAVQVAQIESKDQLLRLFMTYNYSTRLISSVIGGYPVILLGFTTDEIRDMLMLNGYEKAGNYIKNEGLVV